MHYEDIRDKHDTVEGVGGTMLAIYGVGILAIQVMVKGEWWDSEMTDVLYVPGLGRNLFSELQAVKTALDIIWTNASCKLIHHGEVVMEGNINNDLWNLLIQVKPIQGVEARFARGSFAGESKYSTV